MITYHSQKKDCQYSILKIADTESFLSIERELEREYNQA